MLQYVAQHTLQEEIKMLHIKDDLRSQKTADALAKAMLRCLKEKSLNEISVSDLYRETGIARSTFYRLFDTPEDVLQYLCEQYLKDMTSHFEGRTFADIRELSIVSIELSLENDELLEVLVKNHRLELLTQMYAANFQHIISRVTVLQGLGDNSREYVLDLLYMTMATLQTTWIKRGRRESPEQLFGYLKDYQNVILSLLDSDLP